MKTLQSAPKAKAGSRKHTDAKTPAKTATKKAAAIKEDIALTRRHFHELENHARAANEQLRMLLSGLSREEMISRLKQLNLSPRSLAFLSNGIILEQLDHDIRAAIEEAKNNIVVVVMDDPTDHLNYLNL